jgi:MFS family permease
MAVIGTLSFNMSVITPLMAKLEFDGDAATLSWMIIALGCGALVGALVFASRASVTPRLMVYSGLVFGGLLVLCALSPTLAAFLGVLAFVGAVQTVFLTATNSIIQLRAEPSMRGRVMGVYNVTVLGSTPIGGPLIGLLGQTFGPRWAFMVEAGGVFVGMAAFGTMFLRACRRQGDSYEQSVLPDSDHVVVAPAPAVGPAPAPSPG